MSVTNAAATKNDKNTSIAMEGSIDISEPRGILFLDRVVGCCIDMGIDSSNAVWCLKTFFVGYSDDDLTTYITDVVPIMFLALDVTGSFTEQGGSYNITFVCMSHGAGRLPQYAKSGTAINFKTGATLVDTLVSLQGVITSNYQSGFNCISDTVGAMDNGSKLQQSLRPITYKIEVDQYYSDPSYTITDQLSQVTNDGKCNSNATLRIEANTSIESGIHTVMAACQKVKNEQSTPDNNGHKYGYKIHITNSSVNNCDSTIGYTITYVIKREIIHTPISLQQIASGTVPDTTPADNATLLQQNLLEFDYLYTGHNIDILEFDMKLSMGLAYLNIATSINSYNTSLGKQPNVVHTVSTQSLNNMASRQGAEVNNTQVTFGTIIKNPINRNSNDNATSTQSAYTMAKHASLEVSQVACKIIGNPRLLSNINKNSAPSQTIKTTIDSPKSNDDALSGWGSYPSLAKINIKMPRNNDDASLFMGASQNSTDNAGNYAVDFWFSGYYNLLEIEHTFDSGEFTQTLNMIGIPDEGAVNTLQNVNKAVSSCYDNNIGCNKSQGKPPVAIPEKLPSMDNTNIPTLAQLAAQAPGSGIQNEIPGSVINPGTKANIPTMLGNDPRYPGLIGSSSNTDRAISNILSSNANLSDIEGYDSADISVKNAIDNAATQTNMTPSEKFLLTNIIATESGFNTIAKNPNSTAKGLGQFVDGTWAAFGQGNVLNPNDNAIATAKYMKYNEQYLTKSLGRTPTYQEIYLAHKEGSAGAVNILLNPTSNGIGKQNIAYSDLRRSVTGTLPYVSNSMMFNNSDVPDIIANEKRLNRDAIAASRDCGVEQKITQENKNDCTNKPTGTS